MKLYNFDRDKGRIVIDGLDTGVPQNWALYSACEVDAEIARLKALTEEISKQCYLYHPEHLVLKAALRWCLDNGAHAPASGAVWVLHEDGYSTKENIPPQFAAVIAEAIASPSVDNPRVPAQQ